MGWLNQWTERRRFRAVLATIVRIRGSALPEGLERAVAATVTALPPKALGRPKDETYAAIILTFARQTADANMRLASSHWSSGGGRNVGMDVRQAEGRARALILKVMARRPASRRTLAEVVNGLDEMIVAQRADALDADGYGLGTLHEIRRDLAELAIAESAARN